jgi:hypothetical protein
MFPLLIEGPLHRQIATDGAFKAERLVAFAERTDKWPNEIRHPGSHVCRSEWEGCPTQAYRSETGKSGSPGVVEVISKIREGRSNVARMPRHACSGHLEPEGAISIKGNGRKEPLIRDVIHGREGIRGIEEWTSTDGEPWVNRE